jgi:hypothetical protein
MKRTAAIAPDFRSANRGLAFAMVIALAILCVASLVAAQGLAQVATPSTGFVQPYAGTPKYERYAPTEATTASQINRPLGQKRADRIARTLGLNKRDAFTARQYRLFVSGRGVRGKRAPAKLVDESVRILTNTTGRPLYVTINNKVTAIVLSSYGLFVNTDGKLESPGNTDAPTRQVNAVIKPGGYLGRWCRRNGCRDSIRMLYRSAYTSEVVFGNRSQQQTGVAQLVPNQKGDRSTTVGMSMAPSIWIVNFALIYTLKPELAAKMPARWTPIPENVVQALEIETNTTGQVPFSDYISSFPGCCREATVDDT